MMPGEVTTADVVPPTTTAGNGAKSHAAAQAPKGIQIARKITGPSHAAMHGIYPKGGGVAQAPDGIQIAPKITGPSRAAMHEICPTGDVATSTANDRIATAERIAERVQARPAASGRGRVRTFTTTNGDGVGMVPAVYLLQRSRQSEMQQRSQTLRSQLAFG